VFTLSIERRFVLAASAYFLCAATNAIAQSARPPTRVLLLYQQQAEAQPMRDFTQQLRATLQTLDSPIEFYQESLDLERFEGRELSSSLVQYFAGKYRGFGIDVVVPVGARALKFAIDDLSQVLPRVPIVFALSSAPQVDTAALPANVTGRLSGPARFTPTLALARRLQPDAERIVVVGGTGPFDSASVSAALAAIAPLRDSIQLTVLQGQSFDGMLRELRHIPRRSIVLFANYRQDALGQLFEPVDVVGTLARAASAPMYVQLSHYIGEGALGGSVIRFDDEGTQTGRLILRVLRRRPGERMPPLESITKSFVVDARQLRRWEISENRLPHGTLLRFREPTLWEQHRAVVLLTVLVLSAQLLLIGNLLVERRRRKRTEIILETQRRQAEEARLQIAHMGRVALVGELAATISHELRQPLAAIRINAEAGAHLLANPSTDREEASEIFQSIVSDDERAVEVIESIRRLVRKDEPTVTTLDLNQICRDAVRLLQHDAASRGTRIEMSLASPAPLVTGDAVQLQQVVLNLVLNGLDAAAMSTGERFVIVTTETSTNHVELQVHDSGPGLPPSLQPHLFESFFSTKKAGLGLGLVIVRSIVERHSGQVRAENHELGGAVFSARLPRVMVEEPPGVRADSTPALTSYSPQAAAV